MSREQINSSAGELHKLSREILGIDWYDTESTARRVIEWIGNQRNAGVGTPSHRWTVDPHAGQYDGERAELMLGDYTDDELANAVYLHGNEAPDFCAVLAGKAHMPVAYLTAAKERIRWLSRKLDSALAALAVWHRPEPWGANDVIPLGEGSITGEAYHRGVEAGRRQKGGTPLLSSLASKVEDILTREQVPDLYDFTELLEGIQHLIATPLPDGLEIRAMGDANTYAVLKDGSWVANVRMNGEMTVDRQTAYLHAVCSGWKTRPPALLPARMTEQREIQELLGRFGVYGAVPTGVATQIYNAALDHVSELNEKLADLPLKVVADISGGALHGVYAEVPVDVLFISDDSDDVASQREVMASDDEMYRDTDGNIVAGWRMNSEGGQDAEVVEHFFEQKV